MTTLMQLRGEIRKKRNCISIKKNLYFGLESLNDRESVKFYPNRQTVL